MPPTWWISTATRGSARSDAGSEHHRRSGIFSATDLQDSEFLATASVMKMVINGYAGAGTIEMGGYDYHDSTRATGETRDFKAGQCIGACLEYAARVGVPLMIYVFSDGSLVSNGMTDNSVAGRGKGVWTADNTATAASLMLVYDPQGKPTALSNQIGSYNADGTVNATSQRRGQRGQPAGRDRGAELHGAARSGGAVPEPDVWACSGQRAEGLGAAATYDSLIAFAQLPSVSNGVILPADRRLSVPAMRRCGLPARGRALPTPNPVPIGARLPHHRRSCFRKCERRHVFTT